MTDSAGTRRRRAVSKEDKSKRRGELMAVAKKVLARNDDRPAWALSDQFEKHLGSIYERFIDDIEKHMIVAQQRGTVINAPPRMLAFSLAAPIGQLAHRRLTTDDGVTADEVADIVVSFSLNGLRSRES
jgi:hypothetical protein